MNATDPPGVRRAWAWVAHLAAGGTTPWGDWTATGPAEATSTRGRVLPGAQQLELLRRLNLAGAPAAGLAERVLDASAPGRGRPDFELVGAGETLAFGPPPVDPGALPDDELIRVAAGLLAEDLVATELPPAEPPGWTRPWRRRYQLLGDPWLTEPLRVELTHRGRPQGGRGALVVLRATSLDQMLVDAWTARSFGAGAPAWADWLEHGARRRGLPGRLDLVGTARLWSGRVGVDQVHVVLDKAALPALLGVRRLHSEPAAVSAAGVELARRVGQALALLVTPDRRRDLLRRGLRPLVATDPGPSLGVPAEHLGWVRRRAGRMRDALLEAGYPVHGDPDALLPHGAGEGGVPDDTDTLALAVRLLLAGGEQRDDRHGKDGKKAMDGEGRT